MFKYPLEKYKFYIATRYDNGKPYKVIAVSTYEGKKVRGVAKCDESDNFDIEKGKKLAAARCNLKIATKRRKRADKQYDKANEEFIRVMRYYNDMHDYFTDSLLAEREAEEELDALLRSM